MPEATISVEQCEQQLQHHPELRRSIEELLARIHSHVGADQGTALAAHVERNTPPRFNELAPFREQFLRCLQPAQEEGVRAFGNLLWRLLLSDAELCRRTPAESSIRSNT